MRENNRKRGMNINVDDLLAKAAAPGSSSTPVTIARVGTQPSREKKRTAEEAPTAVPTITEVGTGLGSGLGVRASRAPAGKWFSAGLGAPFTLDGLTVGSSNRKLKE